MASKRKTKKAAKKAEACRIVEFSSGNKAEFCSHKAGASTQAKREASLKLADAAVCSAEWREKVNKAARARRGKKAKQIRNLLAMCKAA